MQEDLGRHNGNPNREGGHQSEPTTPPEYQTIREHRESSSGFPTVLSRPNRYSTSSITAPLGQMYSRPGRSSTITSNSQFGMLPSRFTMDENVMMKSGSGSRRGSDEEDDKEMAVRQDPSSHRSSDRYVKTPYPSVMLYSASPIAKALRLGMRCSPSHQNVAEASALEAARRRLAALALLLLLCPWQPLPSSLSSAK